MAFKVLMQLFSQPRRLLLGVFLCCLTWNVLGAQSPTGGKTPAKLGGRPRPCVSWRKNWPSASIYPPSGP